jgi:hypothetical protein
MEELDGTVLSGLSAQAVRRSMSSPFSQLWTWFQLAKFWLPMCASGRVGSQCRTDTPSTAAVTRCCIIRYAIGPAARQMRSVASIRRRPEAF